MDKKADWRQSLRQALKDKRLIGAGIAGLAGGAAGAFGLPDLIYKKPTTGSRLGLGLTSAAIAAAATAAAMSGKDKDSSVLQNVADLAHNVPTLGRRKTVPELKEMSGLSRFAQGYGIDGHPWTQYLNPIRLVKGGLPDWSGLFGKSRRQKELQEKGDLPKSDEPSSLLSWGKGVVNIPLATAGGIWHGSRVAERWRNREYANRLLDFYKTNKTGLKNSLKTDPAGKKLLAQLYILQRKANKNFWPRMWDNFKDTWKSKVGKNTGVNPNLVGGKLLQNITSHPVIQGGSLHGPLQKLMQKPKMSIGRKALTATRGLGRSALILAALGLGQELLSGGASNRTMRNDLARNLNLE